MEGRSPVTTLGHHLQMMHRFIPPTSFTFPTNLLAVQRDSCLRAEWPRAQTPVGPLGCWRPPKTAVLRGCARAKQGGSGRLPAFPFNGNYALFASLQKGVSRGQRVREGGPPRGEGAGGRGADCPRQLLGLQDTPEKADLGET